MNKVKDRIFGMQQRFHDEKDSKGIGLYLVHHHITSMGGAITVSSEPDKGTSFIIKFPHQ
ncbi:sensory histidine kinase DcuS [compost metagenome]